MRYLIDLSEVTDIARLSRNDFDAITQNGIRDVMNAIYNQIHVEANKALKSTRSVYKANINRPEIGRLEGSITLTGQIPNMIEQGVSAFDMKTGFAKSKKAKFTKDGHWYFTVPFRLATSGAIGESEAFSGSIPAEVERAVKKLTPSQSQPFAGIVKSGKSLDMGRLKAIKHGVFAQVSTRPQITGSGLSPAQEAAYTHKAPKLAGLTRQQSFYGLVNQGKYMTFRRVSDRSDPNAFIHPGIKAYDLMPKSVDKVDIGAVMSDSIDRQLNQYGI